MSPPAAKQPVTAEPARRRAIARARCELGHSYLRGGHFEQARATFKEALEDVGDDPPPGQAAVTRHGSLFGLATTAWFLGDHEAAREAYRDDLALLKRMAAGAPQNATPRVGLITSSINLALVLSECDDHAAADAPLQRAIEVASGLARDLPNVRGPRFWWASALVARAEARLHRHQPAPVAAWLDEADALLDGLSAEDLTIDPTPGDVAQRRRELERARQALQDAQR